MMGKITRITTDNKGELLGGNFQREMDKEQLLKKEMPAGNNYLWSVGQARQGKAGGAKGRMGIDMVLIIDGIITRQSLWWDYYLGRIVAERRLIIKTELLSIATIYNFLTFSSKMKFWD